jgi:hypothetical protein
MIATAASSIAGLALSAASGHRAAVLARTVVDDFDDSSEYSDDPRYRCWWERRLSRGHMG